VRLRRGDPHMLAGPFALDALNPADRARFERHLARCEDCREETRGLAEAAARLAVLSTAVPPPELRERVLAAAAATRQPQPLVLAGSAGSEHASLARRAAFSPVLVPRLAVAIGGMLALLALALGSLTVTARHTLGMEQARSHQIAMIMNAPDAMMVTASAAGGGTATVVMSHRDRAMVLTTARLPAPPHGMGYQLWLMGPAGPRAGGMLPAPRQGMTPPVVVSGLAGGDRIELTVEPAAGAPHPTSRPVLVLTLP
jgi:anti-sigma-K factor RskA